MKIIHSSGEAYDLAPGTELEMERTNPFFNEHGEQSIPITLPATERNRRLTGYPDDLANISKQAKRIDAVIQNGVFHIKSRQAVLSAKKKGGISTSFYLNEGAFNERFKDLQLSDIFKDKVINFQSVDAAIQFVRGLMVNRDERFACFPVLLNNDGSIYSKYLNETTLTIKEDGYRSLYNETAKTETVGEDTISLSPGFYITPFIKGNHLLGEIFSHLGYTLVENFFTQTVPFSDMVFLNNTIDTIVKGEIRYSQIVPDCMASTILNVYRNKFCCEFIPNEADKTIQVVIFDHVINNKPERDLTSSLTSELEVSHPGNFRQIKLSAEKQETETTDSSEKQATREGTPEYKKTIVEYDSLRDLFNKYPDAEVSKITGEVFRIGFLGTTKIKETLGTIHCNYYAGGALEMEHKESTDVYIEMRYTKGLTGIPRPTEGTLCPYIGAGRALNSTILLDKVSEETTSDVEEKKTDSSLKPMLCFTHHSAARKYDIGTIYNYDEQEILLWNYTLSYNGKDGLFERFWRKYDNLLRNSLLEVSAEQLFTEEEKISLSSFKKVIIKNQELLPNSIKYSPGLNQPKSCTYLTTKLYSPISEAMPEAERFHPSLYYWHSAYSVSNSKYTRFSIKEKPSVIYYSPPTPSQYSSGGKYYSKTHAATLLNNKGGSEEGTVTIWLEAMRY